MELNSTQLPRWFWERILPDENGCWLWIGNIAPTGYGRRKVSGKSLLMHRVAFAAHMGSVIPVRLEIDHLCRVRRCANPSHLEMVTCRENVLRGVGPSAQNAAKHSCVHGHSLTGNNLMLVKLKNGRAVFQCRACAQRFRRDYDNRQKRIHTGERDG